MINSDERNQEEKLKKRVRAKQNETEIWQH